MSLSVVILSKEVFIESFMKVMNWQTVDTKLGVKGLPFCVMVDRYLIDYTKFPLAHK